MKNYNVKLKGIFLIALVFSVAVVVTSSYPGIYQKIIRPVLAEDDDEEEDEDEDNDHFKVIDTSPSNNTAKKNETKTITTKLADTITQTTTTTIKHDSDGDGKYDEEDPHPTINEYFIVQDANLNGIDDQYEQQ